MVVAESTAMTEETILRPAREDDHTLVVESIQLWWRDSRSAAAARELSLLVPRLFLQHFAGTSLIAEQSGRLRGFLIGFDSADRNDQSYIHFVGVDPACRGEGLARRLHQTFFARAASAGRTSVHAITSPSNSASIAFHQRMGFTFESSDRVVDGIPVKTDYDGLGHDRVAFVRQLDTGS